jgi:hypothetical protein
MYEKIFQWTVRKSIYIHFWVYRLRMKFKYVMYNNKVKHYTQKHKAIDHVIKIDINIIIYI